MSKPILRDFDVHFKLVRHGYVTVSAENGASAAMEVLKWPPSELAMYGDIRKVKVTEVLDAEGFNPCDLNGVELTKEH